MKRLLFLSVLSIAGVSLASLPKATLTGCAQDERSGLVTVNYTLDAPAVVTVDFQTNVAAGAWASIGEENFTTLAGDVNRYVSNTTAGATHTIRWPALNDWAGHDLSATEFRAVLTAWPTNDPPAYMAVDLGAKLTNPGDNTRVRYYVSSNAVPGGVMDKRYRRTVYLLKKIDCANKVFRLGGSNTEYCHYPEGTSRSEGARNKPYYAKLTQNFYIGVFQMTVGHYMTVAAFRAMTGLELPCDWSLIGAMGGVMSRSTMRGDAATYNWPVTDAVGGKIAVIRSLVNDSIAFDLPLSAQYEIAARGGFNTSIGDGSRWAKDNNIHGAEMMKTNVYNLCWMADNWQDAEDPVRYESTDGKPHVAHYAGLKRPNGYGLYDMNGNGRSRCRDVWALDPAAVTTDAKDADGVLVDPKGPVSSDPANAQFVGRGGRWSSSFTEYDWPTFARNPQSENGDYNYTGVRLVCPTLAPAL